METYFLNLLTVFIQYICMFELAFKYTKQSILKYRLKILAALPLILLSATLQFFAANDVSRPFISVCFMILSLLFIFRKRIIETVILYTITFLPILLLKIIMTLILNLSPFDSTPKLLFDILTLIITMSAILLTNRFFDMNRWYTTLMSLNSYIKTAWACTFIAVLAIQVVISARLTSTADLIILFTMIVFILFVNFDGILFQKEFNDTKKELESYEHYMPIVQELIDYIRIRQHDFDNCLQAVQMFPVIYEDYDSITKALNSFEKHAEIDHTKLELLKINLKLVAGFLISKSSDAKALGKNVQIKIKNYNLSTSLPEYTLIELYGILMDNALEAISEGDTVFIEINSKDGKIIFNIRNKGPVITPKLRESIFQKGYSTKNADSHNRGIGLYKLKNTIDENNGIIILDNEKHSNDNYISFTIIV